MSAHPSEGEHSWDTDAAGPANYFDDTTAPAYPTSMSEAKTILLAVTLAEHGGVQEFLLRLALHLRTHGHQVSVAAGDGDWLFDACRAHHIPCHRLRHLHRAIHPWHDLLAVYEIKRLLTTIKPDAVHLNSSKMGALGSLAAHLAGVPRTIYRIGGWVFLEPLLPLTRWCYQVSEKISARWKDIIVCVHPADADQARSLNIRPRQQLLTIPNGIDLPVFEHQLLSRAQARQKLELSHHAFVFGTIANFFPAKDLPRYLEACALVHRQHPDARFVIVGDGPERNLLEHKRQQLGLEQATLLPGRLEQASQYLRAFDAYVLPSAKEGMSWSLLEAMAAELPCLATTVGANPWLLQNEAGWLVPPQDPLALATSMLDCLTDHLEASRRAKRAKQRIKQDLPLNHTLEKNARAIVCESTPAPC